MDKDIRIGVCFICFISMRATSEKPKAQYYFKAKGITSRGVKKTVVGMIFLPIPAGDEDIQQCEDNIVKETDLIDVTIHSLNLMAQ